ncbi:MAG: hypothetical protein JZU60_03850 [Ilumatobacteraceae bacterium]|nr:hypothetical protein [Ilumatobacteraceae bacterium]
MLKRNILANYLGTGAAVLAPVLALPWYLGALGAQQFGLISFVVMLQAVLGLLDAGMSQALVREVTVRHAATAAGRRNTANLLFGFERIYWLSGLAAGTFTWLLADVIVLHWLHLDGAAAPLGRTAITGAAVIFAVQFPGSIYRSLLVGIQSQVTLNGIVLVASLLRHAGGVAVVLAWPSVLAYLLWHAAMALLETLARGQFAWAAVGIRRSQVHWNAPDLQPVWRLVASMSGVTLLGALTVQMDKIILSRMAPLEQFGFYAMASVVATGMLQLVYPLVQAMLPRAIQLRENSAGLRQLNISLTKLIFLLVIVCSVIFAIFGKWFLMAWIRHEPTVAVVYPVLSMLLAGTALNAFYNIGYMNWMVFKRVEKIFFVNILSLVLAVLWIPFLVSLHGVQGAAFGWIVINAIGFAVSLDWIKRY